MLRNKTWVAALFALSLSFAAFAQPVTTAFAFQGELKSGSVPVNGLYDFRFRLFDSSGGQVGPTLCSDSITVSSGAFTVQLDFGSQFNGEQRYLEVQARPDTGLTCSNSTGFTVLSPRQLLTATPNATFAMNMRGISVDAAGDVGIGTSNPVKKLQVGDSGVVGSEGMIHLSSRSGTGTNNLREWNIGVPQTGDSLGGEGYSFVIRDANLNSTAPQFMIHWGTGNVGIGTATPGGLLETRGIGDHFRMTTPSGAIAGHLAYNSASTDGGGDFALYGPSNQRRFYVESYSTAGNPPTYYPNNGIIGLDDINGTSKVRIFVSQTDTGVIQADAKNFCIPNPNNDEQDIVYCCIEGPEAAMYDRGTAHLVDGRAHISLPEHFSALALPSGITVTLTPGSGASMGLAWENRSQYGFDVVELRQGTGTYDFDWEVKAVRRGYADYKAIRPWDDVLPSGRTRDDAWKSRMADIARRNRRYESERTDPVLSPTIGLNARPSPQHP